MTLSVRRHAERLPSMCSLAQAAVSGCGDAYAAGIGVSVSQMEVVGTGGLSKVLKSAFAGATTITKTVRDAAAVSQSIAIAFGSALPCEHPDHTSVYRCCTFGVCLFRWAVHAFLAALMCQRH
jgi:hypothetical protein